MVGAEWFPFSWAGEIFGCRQAPWLHHDETYARNVGLPGVFAMGLLHAGILGDHLAHWVGPDNIRRFAVRFTGQVWPGDELTLTGRVERSRIVTACGSPTWS